MNTEPGAGDVVFDLSQIDLSNLTKAEKAGNESNEGNPLLVFSRSDTTIALRFDDYVRDMTSKPGIQYTNCTTLKIPKSFFDRCNSAKIKLNFTKDIFIIKDLTDILKEISHVSSDDEFEHTQVFLFHKIEAAEAKEFTKERFYSDMLKYMERESIDYLDFQTSQFQQMQQDYGLHLDASDLDEDGGADFSTLKSGDLAIDADPESQQPEQSSVEATVKTTKSAGSSFRQTNNDTFSEYIDLLMKSTTVSKVIDMGFDKDSVREAIPKCISAKALNFDENDLIHFMTNIVYKLKK